MSDKYGIVKKTVINSRYVRFMRLSSGYDYTKAKLRCDELNRVQKPKNTERLFVEHFVSCK